MKKRRRYSNYGANLTNLCFYVPPLFAKHNLFVVKQFGQNPNGKDGVEDVRANGN